MATNYTQAGNVLTYAHASAVASGAPVAIENIVGVAVGSYGEAEAGSYSVEGVFELPKAGAAGEMKVGEQAFLVAGNIAAAIGAGIFAGTVAETAAADATTIKVRINFGNYGEPNA
jgi:predicted RecA/RadA family phage recombinase